MTQLFQLSLLLMRRRLRQSWALSALGILSAVMPPPGRNGSAAPKPEWPYPQIPHPTRRTRPALFYDQIPPDSGVALRKRTRTIRTYARCGFANFGRIRIQIRGIVGINPKRLPENAAANTL